MRSRATEDMLRSPSSKTDPSLSAVAKIRVESEGAGEEVFAMGERMAEPESLRQSKPVDALVDAGVSSAPALAGWFFSCLDVSQPHATYGKPEKSSVDNISCFR